LRKSAFAWLALCANSVAGCAAQNPAAHGAALPAPHSVPGTILSLRNVPAGRNQDSWRAALLADATATSTRDDAPLTEFIVRTDNGAMISIVQPNLAAFHQGDRVTIQQDNRTRLLPSS